jgi:acetyl-CoA C-acetyltransferase
MALELDPRLPIIVGTGQIMIRDAATEPLEPADLMAEALRRAETDSGGTGLLTGADQVLTVSELSWKYRNPALAVAERIGATPRRLATSVVGGNLAGVMVARAAADIQAGAADVIVITGGEATRTRSRLRKAGLEPEWSTQDDSVESPESIGDLRPLVDEIENARGVRLPVHVYPLFEVALRARLGLSVDDHIARVGSLWSAFSDVAATNPNAWIRTPLSGTEITVASAENRMIAWPYTKRLCSNNQVDQGAAVIITSVAAAERAGVPRDRWVFLHAGAEAIDHWNVSHRVDLCSSPALRTAGRDAFALAGIASDDIAHIDLYSCFPAAVQIGAIELGLIPAADTNGEGWGGVGATRPLTVTGGMTFAGGPLNNYPTHGLATMVETLRNDAGSVGLCTANGGYTTEHAVLIASTEPPAAGAYRYSNPQAEVDALPSVACDDTWRGAVTIESATVVFEDVPTHVLIATRTPEGQRSWGMSTDTNFMNAAMTTELVGLGAQRSADGTVSID